MRTRLLLGTILLLVVVVVSACGATPTPAPEPAGPVVLEVKGKVGNALQWSMAEVKAVGVQQINAEHPKNGPTDYEGVFLSAVLAQAAPAGDATTVVFTAADGFSAELPLCDAQECAQCLIAIDGDNLNMVMPGMSSKAWVKTVVSIEVK